MKNLYLIIYFILFNCIQGFGQNLPIDSLKNILKIEKEDTNKCNTLNSLSTRYFKLTKWDSALIYAKDMQALAEKIGFKQGIFNALSATGSIYYQKGNLGISLEYLKNALKFENAISNKRLVALVYKQIGMNYIVQGIYSESLKNYLIALKISQEISYPSVEAYCYNEIGKIYNIKGNHIEAIKNEKKALLISEKCQDSGMIAAGLEYLGEAYLADSNYNESLKSYLASKAIFLKLNKGQGIGDVDYGIGNVKYSTHQYQEALENHLDAIEVFKKINDNDDIAEMNVILSQDYFALGNIQEAFTMGDKGLSLLLAGGEKDNIKDAYRNLAVINAKLNNYKSAYEDETLFKLYYDSIFNNENEKKQSEMQMQFDFNKKEDSLKILQSSRDTLNIEQSKKQKLTTYFVSGLLFLVLLFALFVYRNLKQTKIKNLIITQQKELVEERNKDILASITYAKRLQDAILPPLSIIKQYLPESFVLYEPKDIVAGDFYWMERTGDNILIAAADCTGHGVPGALVSVVCSNALNRTVKEFQITEPGKILDKVRELVLETFEKSESNVQDGMDISLCSINTKNQKIQWSGAYNSLWYIQNGELHEIPADKQPISKTDNPKPFVTHSLNLSKGDILYLFTDGYADQFGGPKGKKFKYKQLQDILLANAPRLMEEQNTILEGYLEEWKGSLEQVDDILVIGIRV